MNKLRENRKAVAATLAVALILAGFGSVRAENAVDGQWLTRGHTQFIDLDNGQSGCFAGLAGILMQKVTWFNGQELFSRAASGGDTWIYVTEHLNTIDGGFDDDTGIRRKDPSRETLYETGTNYTFNVPDGNGNDKTWEVKELFALRDESDIGGFNQAEGEVNGVEKVYVWVVKVSEESFRDPALNRRYNFAMIIDTCKFHTGPDRQSGEHNNTDNEGDPALPQNQHDPDSPPGTHDHGEFMSDVWVGGPPDVSPIPTDALEEGDPQTGDPGTGGDAS